ncbi:MAG: NTP transferase domain-containing protein [Verrucomicrobiota bacterium]|nr:NTP transferase domain-containing protein [Verrucomicrobiota bacterium]
MALASCLWGGLEARLLHRLEAAGSLCHAALLCLCDQPHVSPATLCAIVAAHRLHGARIVASEYGGALGAPALFHVSLFDELRALSGDEGARKLLAQFSSEVASVPHAAAALDLDTQADRERLLAEKCDDRGAASTR